MFALFAIGLYLKGMRITAMHRLLIIDSNEKGRVNLLTLLSPYYFIGLAHGPDECGLLCAAFKPQVVYFELRMGTESQMRMVFDAIRTYDPKIPLVMSVSLNSIAVERAAREGGVFYYLVRPFTAKELRAVLNGAFAYVRESALPKAHRKTRSSFLTSAGSNLFPKRGFEHS